MSGFQIALLVYLGLSATFTVATVGHERKPITPAIAAATLVVQMIFALLIIVFGG